ncbi:tetratricopeptide repeat protein [Alistipes sp.]|uniref:tetratricopeptide repeat protein n=1 Tax=Alistipes sp. TaxID=1872444 RepID=UPI0011DD73F6|nr:tetratricopeptide repeat protein [Alistipes sp.]
MKRYLLSIFALLIVGCATPRSEQTYDEMLNDVVQNFNVGTIGGDSVLKAFVQKTQADSVARQYSNPAMKEEMMLNLISDYLGAGQVYNAQHLYDNMLKYAEQEYGKVSQMTAIVYFEKAHLYEQTGDLDNAIQMMQKAAEVFEQLPKDDSNRYEDVMEFIRMWEEQKSK